MKKLYTVYDHHTHKIKFADATIGEAAKYLKVSKYTIINCASKDIWLLNRYEFCVEEWPDTDVEEVRNDRDGYLLKIDNLKRNWDRYIYRGSKNLNNTIMVT
jgi:hypothetical protein